MANIEIKLICKWDTVDHGGGLIEKHPPAFLKALSNAMFDHSDQDGMGTLTDYYVARAIIDDADLPQIQSRTDCILWDDEPANYGQTIAGLVGFFRNKGVSKAQFDHDAAKFRRNTPEFNQAKIDISEGLRD